MIDWVVAFLNNTILYNGAAFSIGVLGVALGLVPFFFRKKRRHLFWTMNPDALGSNVANHLDDVAEFEGVKHASVARLAIWNPGPYAIRGSDAVSGNEIRIGVSDGKRWFNAKLVTASSADNRVTLVKQADERSVVVRFDFLDENDGLVIQFVSEAKRFYHLRLDGRLIGCKIKFRISNSNVGLWRYFARRLQGVGEGWHRAHGPRASRRVHAAVVILSGVACWFMCSWVFSLASGLETAEFWSWSFLSTLALTIVLFYPMMRLLFETLWSFAHLFNPTIPQNLEPVFDLSEIPLEGTAPGLTPVGHSGAE
jgi:hypothetical protein